MVYLVRHAHAGSQKRWSGRDQDRPLSARGHEQAGGLLVALDDHPVSRVLTSPAVRCQQTVAPLSQHRGVPLELAAELAVHAPAEELLELVTNPCMQAAVLCGHGEQIRGLLGLLADDLSLAGPLRWQKGSTWILDTEAGSVRACHYLPPLRRKRSPDRTSPALHRATGRGAG